MATIKSFTDISQSKVLADILPLESADMYWWSSGKRYYIEAMDDGDFNKEEGHVRAWSLAALLGVLPNYQLQTQDDGIGILCSCNGNFNIVTADNPIDACMAMIEKLNELEML